MCRRVRLSAAIHLNGFLYVILMFTYYLLLPFSPAVKPRYGGGLVESVLPAPKLSVFSTSVVLAEGQVPVAVKA